MPHSDFTPLKCFLPRPFGDERWNSKVESPRVEIEIEDAAFSPSSLYLETSVPATYSERWGPFPSVKSIHTFKGASNRLFQFKFARYFR